MKGIYKRLSLEGFIKEFDLVNRRGSFSDEGLEILYDILDNQSYLDEQPYELDVIGLCCEYYEYCSIDDLRSDFGPDMTDNELLDYLHNNTFIQEFFGTDNNPRWIIGSF